MRFACRVTADEVQTQTGTPIGIWLELDLSAQPIAGTLSPPGGPPSAFVGWLGLTAALAGLRSGPEPPAGEMAE